MNYTTAVMLFNENIRMIKTSYEPHDKEKTSIKPKLYNYKTLDPDIQVGDYVVVPTDTRHGYTINRVEEVDVEVDFDSNIQIKWVVGKMPIEPYEAVLAQESVWIEEMKKAEIRRKREEIKSNVQEMYRDSDFNASSISNMAHTTAIAPPTRDTDAGSDEQAKEKNPF